MDIKGHVAIVTGSATGLGAATARLLAAKGCKVVVNYSQSAAEAKETQAACEGSGVETLLVQADVGDDGECRRLVAETIEKWGRVDALVNNAGTTKYVDHDDLEGLTPEDFERIFRVNVFGLYQMIRAVTPHMKAAGRGSIVNISSISGVTGIGSSVAYAGSKGAVNTMTLSLARALAPEIRVNAICPGFIGTRWQVAGMGGDAEYQARVKEVETNMPLRRANTPEDIAESVVWFVKGAEWITGETLIVDSGLHLGFATTKAR
ncbi:MAG: SDR family oxidoreductase [Alphaproteobacteria bacterium]|jgi:3-oxoacyl-[acyl-carrier protein] reductase|nr:SDR family oxidoreductase [Alphaproteobacteria bacterium]